MNIPRTPVIHAFLQRYMRKIKFSRYIVNIIIEKFKNTKIKEKGKG